MARSTINNGDSGLAVRTALNAMLLELYGMASQPDYVAGRWYNPLKTTVAGGGTGQNTIQFVMFALMRPVTISDLGANVTTLQAANNFQLAIYAADPTTFRPTGSPLAVTGDISTAVAAAVSGDITGANVTLAAGFYWAAVNQSGATSVIGATSGGFTQNSAMVGSTTLANLVSGTGTGSLKLTFASTYNTWPDMTSQTLTEAAGAAGPLLFFKAA